MGAESDKSRLQVKQGLFSRNNRALANRKDLRRQAGPSDVTAQERAEFIAVVDALARSGLVWTIATLRADFLSRLSDIPVLVRLMEGGGEYRLLPPSREELGQMIRLPGIVRWPAVRKAGQGSNVG